MNAADWYAHVRQCETAPDPERAKRQAEALTLEFNQPLIQQYRRRRPRRRGQPAPMFDPQQTRIGEPTK